MTKEELKQIIVDIVVFKQGCKLMDLINSEQFIQAFRVLTADYTIDDYVNELIKEKRLIEVRYILPWATFSLKSFLLPTDTYVSVNDGTNLTIIGEE